MSTAEQTNESALGNCCSGPSYLLVRRLQSLTGLMFGGYLLVHLLVNATIAQGGDHYQVQVNKIHELPMLEAIEWSFLFIPFLYHAFYGIWITVNGRPNVTNYPYARNIYYLIQRISAVIILLFVLFHVLSLKFGVFGSDLQFIPKSQALASIGHHIQYAWWVAWVIYPIGVLASAYHTANGLWTGAITWGLTISATSQKRFGYICSAIFLALAGLGIVATIAAANLDPATLPPAPAGVSPAH